MFSFTFYQFLLIFGENYKQLTQFTSIHGDKVNCFTVVS